MIAHVAASSRPLLDVLFATLWQGAAIAAAFALVAAAGRHSASTRCILWQIALATMILVPLGTTLLATRGRHVSIGGVALGAASIAKPSGGAVPKALRFDLALSDDAVCAIVACWLAGVLYRTTRIGVAAMRLERLVRESERIADRDATRVFVSPLLQGPLTFGLHLPTIVLPATLVRSGGIELEHVLAHELAHVARADARATLAERIANALLFFNPVVSAVVGAIAFEREASCDDRAIAATRDATGYARSLATIALRNATANQADVSIASSFAHSTPRRIARLLDAGHDGRVAPSLATIGGFLAMSITLGMLIVTLAPAVAFGPPAPRGALVASTACASQAHVINPRQPQVSNVTVHHPLRTEVKVRIAADGRVLGTALYKSSGNAAFDADVVTAAGGSTYAPQQMDCKPVTSSYVFMAQLGP